MSVSLKQELSAIKDKAVQRALKTLFENQVVLEGSETWNVGSLAAAASESNDITVTGAALGDFVLASLAVDIVDMNVTAAVTAANTVTVTVDNQTGGTVDLASATVYVRVFPQTKAIVA